MSLDELEHFHYVEIAPAMTRDSKEAASSIPTYRWLTKQGYSGIAYALREHHDLTVTEFYEEVIGISEKSSGDDYDWMISCDSTIEKIERYLNTRQKRRNHSDNTVNSKRSRLAQFARIYEDIHGHSDIHRYLDEGEPIEKEITRCLAVFDEIDDRRSTTESKIKYFSEIKQFYDHLVNLTEADENPIERVMNEFDLEREDPDNKTVGTQQMRNIYATARDNSQKLLILGLGGWGLRPNEVASLHRSQIKTGDEGHRQIEFDERKNGPGTVSIIYGYDVLEKRANSLTDEGWNGYLFPSSTSKTGHINPATVNNRFKRISQRAGVTVDGELPTAKMGRRFWYSLYKEAMSELYEQLEPVAEDQGSSSISVIESNYLPKKVRREHRHRYMKKELAAVFDV